jgi:hypothetical protein
MFAISLFSFLNTYISDSIYTNALIKGLKRDELEYGGDGLKDAIKYSLKTYKEEGKQLFFVADYIKGESRQEVNATCVLPLDEKTPDHQVRADRLGDFIGDIYDKIDYYEVAKQLTKYYKEQQKTNTKKIAK